MQHPKLEELIRRDPRFPAEAYEFLFAALAHTQELLGRTAPTSGEALAPDEQREYHVTGKELLRGIRDLALREFGLMARSVFRSWGIHATDDFGAIVFNLVEVGIWSKTPEDDPRDFHAAFDLDDALTRDYRIEVPTETEEPA